MKKFEKALQEKMGGWDISVKPPGLVADADSLLVATPPAPIRAEDEVTVRPDGDKIIVTINKKDSEPLSVDDAVKKVADFVKILPELRFL